MSDFKHDDERTDTRPRWDVIVAFTLSAENAREAYEWVDGAICEGDLSYRIRALLEVL